MFSVRKLGNECSVLSKEKLFSNRKMISIQIFGRVLILFDFREEERLRIINYSHGWKRKEKREKNRLTKYTRVDTYNRKEDVHIY
jgi:hypothetical protein